MVLMFHDRYSAGRQLTERLAELHLTDPLILGLPRGGVPVARAVADELDADMDIVLVRKLGHPRQRELALGAIGESGHIVLNDELIRRTGVSDEDLESVIDRERAELARRVESYRSVKPPVSLTDRVVVLVDDGIATGATMRAAIDVVRTAGARLVVVAAPVAPGSMVETLTRLADDVVIVEIPTVMGSVGQFYRDFRQITDDEVVEALGSQSS